MPKANSVPHPKERNSLNEPDCLLDQLLAYLHWAGDTELDRWAVQTLADELAVKVIALPDDPVTEVEELGAWWVTAVMVAGQNRELKRRLWRLVEENQREILEVFHEWLDEGR